VPPGVDPARQAELASAAYAGPVSVAEIGATFPA
jgi:hypothetical protein